MNMSGCGALLAVAGDVPLGSVVQIRADWPAVREGWRGAILLLAGKVVRNQPGFVAVEIGRYEIRPFGSSAANAWRGI